MDFGPWFDDDKIVGNVFIGVILGGCESERDWEFRIANLIRHRAWSTQRDARDVRSGETGIRAQKSEDRGGTTEGLNY